MRIFLASLPYDLDDHGLREELARVGIVPRDVHVVRDRDTDRSKGYGFIEVDGEDALERLRGSGFSIGGRAIVIDRAHERERRGGGGERRRDVEDTWREDTVRRRR